MSDDVSEGKAAVISRFHIAYGVPKPEDNVKEIVAELHLSVGANNVNTSYQLYEHA